MAETLGSLVDKLAIKSIREFHIKKAQCSVKLCASKKELSKKLEILINQKKALIKEIQEFIAAAAKGEVILREDKLKLYNKPEIVGKIGSVRSVAKAIDGLAKKNSQLWNLEDDARREDRPLSYIGTVKKKIDKVNQQRNDFIDMIDKLFEKDIKEYKKR